MHAFVRFIFSIHASNPVVYHMDVDATYTHRAYSRMHGLLVVEHSYVSLEGTLSEIQLGVYDDSFGTRA